MTMLSAKKLIKMPKRWQKFAAKQRKRISFPRNDSNADGCSTSSSSIVEKGHFVVYTIDQRSYAFPLTYLENEVITQLLTCPKKSLVCQVVALLHYPTGVAAGDLHKALLRSIPSCCVATSFCQQESRNQQILVY
ncbi:hypothetical protein H5410_052424 [Solanum commersonii]|uniref:SAUR family protein n=1 Tax=Solanum commersonii TaxID=4109 RepID=A0A9J5X2Z9_SOLCO|nr:hypothetical protein H5410_052424 [Solanum commersonii]